MNPPVVLTAQRHDRSFAQPQAPRTPRTHPPLLFWRRLLNHAVDEAKKTAEGLPSDMAILARWWIADCRPPQSEKDDWERSFDCACHWLNIDPDEERKRLLRVIDHALKLIWIEVWVRLCYQRRAMVLSCAGLPTAIAKQYLLPLASVTSYEEVAGVDKPDMFAEMDEDEL